MPRISNIELLKSLEQPALTIRTRASVNQFPTVISRGFGKLAAYLSSLGEHLAGTPFVAYHNMDMTDLDVELGFPVAFPLPGSEDIQYAPVPGGLRAFCMYLGPYSGIKTAYDDMAAWITENGFMPAGAAYECYYNGPAYPEEQLLTQIVMPLK